MIHLGGFLVIFGEQAVLMSNEFGDVRAMCSAVLSYLAGRSTAKNAKD